jgi:hypothetical protein
MGQRVMGLHEFFQTLGQDMGVDLRGRDVGVAEEFL